jgi:hypothetical protein
MFSDFKTRGFGITQSQIKKPDRLARLILVLAIAMYWACVFHGKPGIDFT